jgi:glutaredoxin
MTRVTIYGKPGCCLCDEARDVVGAAKAAHAFELEEIDITRDPVLEQRYRERIPVVAIDDVEALELVIEASELEKCLARVAT